MKSCYMGRDIFRGAMLINTTARERYGCHHGFLKEAGMDLTPPLGQDADPFFRLLDFRKSDREVPSLDQILSFKNQEIESGSWKDQIREKSRGLCSEAAPSEGKAKRPTSLPLWQRKFVAAQGQNHSYGCLESPVVHELK